MDQYLSAVIIAVISGVFSTITIIIQRNQNKIVSKIDERSKVLEKEKKLKQQIAAKEKELQGVFYDISILVLDTSLQMIKIHDPNGENIATSKKFMDESTALKNKFEKLTEEIDELNTQYSLICDLAAGLEVPRSDLKA